MLISDLARQYIKSTTSTDTTSGTRGVQNLVSSVRDLTAGNIFEGTVNSINGGKVVLGLSNGMELSARLDANMQLVKGQSMFFQVKSNDGATIAIRPYTVDGAGVNLTLLNALKAAGLPITDKNLTMANSMMQEQMPIDKNSMAQMARILMANPDMSVNTAIQMKKLNIPITNEMVAQFENYMDDTNAVHKALDRFISELPATLSAKEMPLEQLKAFDSQFLQILTEGMEITQQSGEITKTQNADAGVTSNVVQTDAGANGETSNTILNNITDTPSNVDKNGMTVNVPETNTSNVSTSGQSVSVVDSEANIVGNVLVSQDGSEITNTAKTLVIAQDGEPVITDQNAETVPAGIQTDAKAESSQEQVVKLLQGLFGDIEITAEDSPASLLNKLSNIILNGENISKDTLMELFSSKSMQGFLREVLEGQMYLTPEDVADSEKVKKLYERLETKTQKLESLLLSAGIKDTPLAQTVADVRGNIDFMNQLNQTYTYVQIPLKMSGQNASGQLYVYTNKRDLGDPERDLTAFLHLDMDNLGSTDVSVRMHRKDVDTKFYMDSDESYALVRAHMPELEARLRKKGFNASVYVENEGKKVDFVEDFLKKDAPSSGQLHRYSFDVRA
ncbi:MAG: flagellar hook-length control protein FliK [Agathobacter sp.]|nr:flagellar hook-length control protein FliK [Agathobacter sp.]